MKAKINRQTRHEIPRRIPGGEWSIFAACADYGWIDSCDHIKYPIKK